MIMRSSCLTIILSLFTTLLSAQVNLNTGLIAHLPLNGNGSDASGNGNNATVGTLGAYPVANQTGIPNSALFFNGGIEPGLLEFSTSVLNNLNAYSMSFWFNVSSITNNLSLVGQDNLLEVGFYTAPNRIVIFHPTSSSTPVNLTVTTNQWVHILLNGSAAGLQVYVNGALATTISGNHSLTSNAAPTRIGGNVVNMANNSFHRGAIDEVRFYNRLLTVAEINLLSSSLSLTYLAGTISPLLYCAGASVNVPFSIIGTGLQPTNIFTAQLSDANGSFARPVSIGTLNGMASGTVAAVIPANLPSGNGYKIRIVSSLPLVIGGESSVITINNPTEGLSTLSRGRMLHLSFDGNTNDISGNSIPATAQGGTSYISDRNGNAASAIQLNGSNGFVDVQDGVYFNGAFSAASWIRPNSFANFGRIFDFGNGQASDNVLACVTSGTTGLLCARTYDAANASPLLTSTASAALNQWSHVTLTYSGSILRLFLNGNLVASATSASPRQVLRAFCYIGRSPWASDAYAQCAYDDFMIWNREITSDEVRVLSSDGMVFSNSPVCTGSILQLNSVSIPGASYSWTGPSYTANGRIQERYNATALMAGNYGLTVSLGGCVSPLQTRAVVIGTNASAPLVTFTGLPDNTNTNGPSASLIPVPTGGYFTGNGISGTSFNPAVSGIGTFVIIYNFQGAATCATTRADTVNVGAGYNMENTTITSCNGGFFDTGGSSGDYQANELLTQTYCSDNGQRLRFTFSQMSLGSGDTLWAYDGNTVNAVNLLRMYIAGSANDVIWSSGTCITFRFRSNIATQAAGWQSQFACFVNPVPASTSIVMNAGITAICDATILDPSGTGNYGQGFWRHTFRSSGNSRLRFTYSVFAINGNNGGHWLRIYDGPDATYPLIGAYNNFNFIPAQVVSSGEFMTFEFDATNTNAGFGGNAGFVGNLTCFNQPLPVIPFGGATQTVCNGVFYDNGGPNGNYSNNLNQTQTYCSNNGEKLRINFNQNEIGFNTGDTLFVYDGNSAAATPLAVFIQGSSMEPMKSTGSCLTFLFKSNASAVDQGWQGFINCVPTQSAQDTFLISSGMRITCNALISDNSGPFNYGQTFNRQTYRSYNGNRLKFEYTQFAINGNNGGHWLRIYDGPNATFPLIGAYNNFNFIPASITSSGQFLTFEFDATNTNAGFGGNQGYTGVLTCITPVLPIFTMSNGTVTTCDAVFYDNGGPIQNYTDNQILTQTFCSGNGQLLQVNFNRNETSFAAGDTLWAFDGNSISAAPLAIYFAGSIIEPLTSTGTCITFRFRSNGSSNARGWQGFISCVTTPPATVVYQMSSGRRYVCNGTFFDPGGVFNYPAGTWEQTFSSFSGQQIRAVVNGINVNGNNGGHWLRVYDGPSTASPIIGSYNNFNGWPPAFQSTGGSLTFRFESTNANAGLTAGFDLTFNCFTGQPIDAGWLPSPVCQGANIAIPFTINTSVNAGNTFTAQLSNASGSFTSAVNIGTLAGVNAGIITGTIPANTPPGNGYRIRIISSNPVQVGSISPNNLIVNPAPQQPSSISNTGLSICEGSGITTLSIAAQTGMNYQWLLNGNVNTGTNSNSIQVIQPGTYTVQLSNSCGNITSTASATVVTTNAPVSAVITAGGPTAFCSGGSVTLSIPTQNGVTYQWKRGTLNVGTNTNTIAATIAGDYTVTVSNSCGTVVSSNTITVINSGSNPTVPTITAAGPLTFCAGGSVSISVPTQSGITYQWKLGNTNVGSNLNTLVASQSGVYSIELSNSCGTVVSSNAITVQLNLSPTAATITAGGATTFCTGQSVSLSTPAQTGVNYQWKQGTTNVGSNINSFIATAAGTYTVVINNACGTVTSTNSISVTISGTAPVVPVITAGGPLTFCEGGSVSLSIPVQSGVAYQWKRGGLNVGINSNNLSANTSGVYTVEVSNTCGSIASGNGITIQVNPVPAAPVITANGPTSFCAGGSVLLSLPAASAYNWSTGASTQSITVTTAITVTGTIIQNGCSSAATSQTITINPVPPAPTFVSAPAVCSGQSALLSVSSGATVNWFTQPSGGTTVGSGLSFNTGPISSNQTFFAEAVNGGCVSATRTQVAVAVNNGPQVSAGTIGQITCNGADNGTITINSTGAVSFLWSNGETTADISGLTGGIYTLTALSANGCSSSLVVTLSEPAAISIEGTVEQLSCDALNDGGIIVQATGGTGNLQYIWNTGATGTSVQNLVAGSYSVTVTDANACVANSTFEITPYIPMTLSAEITPQSGANANGAINITVTGGNPPYNFDWFTGETTEDLTGLFLGFYDVIVTDATGCLVSEIFEVSFSTGITSISGATINVWPIPANEFIVVDSGEESFVWEITDSHGKQILHGNFQGGPKLIVPTAALAQGIYFLKTNSEKANYVRRFVIAR